MGEINSKQMGEFLYCDLCGISSSNLPCGHLGNFCAIGQMPEEFMF